MTEINAEQARALAALVAKLRTDWDLPGICKALWDAKTRAGAWDVAHGALHAALDPKNRTPAVIALGGVHWTKGRKLGSGSLQAPRSSLPGHSSYFAGSCGACRADSLGREG